MNKAILFPGITRVYNRKEIVRSTRGTQFEDTLPDLIEVKAGDLTQYFTADDGALSAVNFDADKYEALAKEVEAAEVVSRPRKKSESA